MSQDVVGWQVFGALRFVDATTGLQVYEPLLVSGAARPLVRNHSGAYVLVVSGDQEAPKDGDLTLTVSDPRGRYLARLVRIKLPRDPDPKHAGQPGSLFRAIEVPLFPAPAASLAPGWAAIRASVTAAATGRPLAGALIRVMRHAAPAAPDAAPLARGLSDARGEALVPVAGLPITTWGDSPGAVVVNEISVTIETIYDPMAGPLPNPDDLEARRGSLLRSTFDTKLAAGRALVAQLAVSLA